MKRSINLLILATWVVVGVANSADKQTQNSANPSGQQSSCNFNPNWQSESAAVDSHNLSVGNQRHAAINACSYDVIKACGDPGLFGSPSWSQCAAELSHAQDICLKNASNIGSFQKDPPECLPSGSTRSSSGDQANASTQITGGLNSSLNLIHSFESRFDVLSALHITAANPTHVPGMNDFEVSERKATVRTPDIEMGGAPISDSVRAYLEEASAGSQNKLDNLLSPEQLSSVDLASRTARAGSTPSASLGSPDWNDPGFWPGFADTTYRPVVQIVSDPMSVLSALGHTMAHPVDAISGISNSTLSFFDRFTSGDPEAIGQATGALVSAVVTDGLANEASVATSSIPSQMTAEEITKAIQNANLWTGQGAISAPAVNRYIDMILNGDIAPAIKVDGNLIVDGNHRYAAGLITGQLPDVDFWSASPSEVRNAQPFKNIKVDPRDWGNH